MLRCFFRARASSLHITPIIYRFGQQVLEDPGSQISLDIMDIMDILPKPNAQSFVLNTTYQLAIWRFRSSTTAQEVIQVQLRPVPVHGDAQIMRCDRIWSKIFCLPYQPSRSVQGNTSCLRPWTESRFSQSLECFRTTAEGKIHETIFGPRSLCQIQIAASGAPCASRQYPSFGRWWREC